MTQKVRYEALDGLRGLAAIGVLCFHFSIIGLPVATHGYLAVDFFFMLSGFVIAHAYSHKLEALAWPDFAKLRFIRVLPLSVAGLLAGTGYFVIRYFYQPQSQYSMDSILLGTAFNLFLIPKPWVTDTPTDTIFSTNTPLWSLSLEIVVNLVWAAFFFRSKWPAILSVAFGSAVVLIVFIQSAGSADLGATWPTYLGGLARAVFSYFAGVFIWSFRQKPDKSSLYPSISAVFLIAIIFAPDMGPYFDILAITMVFPLLIYLASTADFRTERPIYKFIGNLSYPLYVIHVPILMLFAGLSKGLKMEAWTYLLATLSSVTAILAAVALDRLYDRPARRLLTRILVAR